MVGRILPTFGDSATMIVTLFTERFGSMTADAVLPEFLGRVPLVETGIDGVTARAIRGAMLCMLFEFSKDVHVPEHSHGAQFGVVVAGSLRVRKGAVVSQFRGGDSYLVKSGELHEAWIKQGTVLIEFFEDVDRY